MRRWQTCENDGMHTHFGSATNAVGTFLHVAMVGTLWRISAMHLLAVGTKRNMRHLAGFAKAALFQY